MIENGSFWRSKKSFQSTSKRWSWKDHHNKQFRNWISKAGQESSADRCRCIGQDKGIRQYADAPAERVSLKAKLEAMKAKVAGAEKPGKQMDKGKEVTI